MFWTDFRQISNCLISNQKTAEGWGETKRFSGSMAVARSATPIIGRVRLNY